MELTNSFRVEIAPEQAWAVLTDLERIAPCLPGAELREVDGDDYKGVVRIKVGPITAQYSGLARFVDKDDIAHRAVIQAEGRDTRGAGNARASITATLTPDGTGTTVSVVTDLQVTGKVAQFGRGVLADVSAKLMDQFAEALAADIAGESVPDVGAAPLEPESVVAPVDLTKLAGSAVGKRVVPLLGAGLVAFWLLWRNRRRHHRR